MRGLEAPGVGMVFDALSGAGMGPRFRGDDKIGAGDFPRTALRFRGDDDAL
jgi:hypothetical protein